MQKISSCIFFISDDIWEFYMYKKLSKAVYDSFEAWVVENTALEWEECERQKAENVLPRLRPLPPPTHTGSDFVPILKSYIVSDSLRAIKNFIIHN